MLAAAPPTLPPFPMGTVYKNPALVELIVELQWELTPVSIPPGSGVDPFHDLLRSDLSQRLSAEGYTHVMDVVPANVPREFLAWKPMVRFSPSLDTWPKVQLGPGMFSIHAVGTSATPYGGWHTFEPAVTKAIDTFLLAFPTPDKLLRFKSLQLRYMNAFTAKHGYKSNAQFTNTYLGLSSVLPKAFLKELGISEEGVSTNSRTSFSVARLADSEVVLDFADASINGAAGCVLQLGIERKSNFSSRREDIFAWLNDAHGLARQTFNSLVRKELQSIMQPEEQP